MYKITHTGPDIDWVNGPDKPGAENLYLPPEDCGDVLNDKWIYMVAGDACVLRPNAEQIIEERRAREAAEKARREEVDEVKKQEGMKSYTIPQIQAFLQNKLDTTDIENATDLAELKAALVQNNTRLYQIFMKIVPSIMD